MKHTPATLRRQIHQLRAQMRRTSALAVILAPRVRALQLQLRTTEPTRERRTL
jgi:hypothetical protein